VNDLGFSPWSDNHPRAVSLWSVNQVNHLKMRPAARVPAPRKESQYNGSLVDFEEVIFMSGEKIDVPGGQCQHLLKGCLAFPLRNATLRVLADEHGFDGNVVLPGSPVRLFNLATVFMTTREDYFVAKDVSTSSFFVELAD
jgi:hypothetical protein